MEPIAIIGIGCRFPQAQNPEAFWQLLRDGIDAIAPMPQERWNVEQYYDPDPKAPGKMNVREGGFVENVDQFDADLFGMSVEETEHTDPQQRLFLEVAWEALENGGIVPKSLAGSQTGVFVGMCTADYHRLLYRNYDCITTYSGTGTTCCVAANRLSYLLDLRGPSMAIDTACSSSLVTVHLACQSLRSGESDVCLAGGVNLILAPDSTISSSQTGLLSSQGRCRSFDASADGYVRGEGCGVVVLKRLSDAVRDGDNILGLIRGSAVNHNGLSNSMSAPNGLAQQATIRQALRNGNVQPAEIGYVDAHAVGTGIGDAIEFKAISTVLSQGRQSDNPCWIGSVKTNIGHLEAAAGISALIKVVLAMQHEEIPSHLHLTQLNPYISLKDNLFAIPTEAQKWSRGTRSRLAGVSAFGYGGTNAHVILEEAPLKSDVEEKRDIRPQHLITLSAQSETALSQLAQRYEEFLLSQPQISLADLGFTANTGRTHFNHRLCLISESVAQLQQQLQAFTAEEKVGGLWQGQIKGRKRPKVAFLFPSDSDVISGQLYQTQPTFRNWIDQCAHIVQLNLDQSILEKLNLNGQNLLLDNQTALQQCALFANQYALAQLWLAWGVKPKAVIGYGVGEYVAATVAGVLDLETGLKLVMQRSDLIDVELDKGAFSQPKVPIISSYTGEPATEEITTPQYWLERLPQSEANPSNIKALDNYQVVLIMGSKAISETQTLYLSSLRQGEVWQQLLSSLAELYIRGIEINWSSFDRDYCRRRLQLPTYPFQRQRYWFKNPQEFQQVSEQIEQLLEDTGNSEAQKQLISELLQRLAQQRRNLEALLLEEK